MTTTDTPRTDAAFGQGRHGAMKIPYETSCLLERELNEAKQWLDERYKALSDADAEVERLKGIVKAQKDELEAISFALGTNEGHSSVDHIVALKSEVDRLREELISLTPDKNDQ